MDSERILVVDDDPDIRKIVVSFLRIAGYSCTAATSGHDALSVLESGAEFELMLSDLMMPDMDGSTLLQHAKERYPDMQVVMVTAVHDISTALDAIHHGAYDYLLKPFEREQLLNVARRALENRRLKADNRKYQQNLESLVAERTEELSHTMEQLRDTMSKLEQSYDITLEALGDALDLKDAETEGHSKRVTTFTIAIARALRLPSDTIRVIAHGAFLHDIGKMAIPDEVLRKPGPLSPDQVQVMRRHCEYGYQIVRKIPYLKEAAEIVYAHQEFFDGSGYPRGLRGEQIPLGARIFAIADTLDAITSDRPYRKKQTLQAAKDEIVRWAGRQFDPALVKVFLTIPDTVWETLRHTSYGDLLRNQPVHAALADVASNA